MNPETTVYALGRTVTHDAYIAESPHPCRAKHTFVWKTIHDARCQLYDFPLRDDASAYSVYAIEARWNIDTQGHDATNGSHSLLVAAPILRKIQPHEVDTEDDDSLRARLAAALIRIDELERKIARMKDDARDAGIERSLND